MDRDTPLFVTGGTGFIGAYLIRSLVSRGYTRIRALCRPTSSFELVGTEARQAVEWIEGDILDLDLLEEAMRGVEGVYHLAAGVSFDQRDRAQMQKVNVEGTVSLLEASKAVGVKKFLHMSSVAALGRSRSHPHIDESTKWERSALNSFYGITKFQAEMEVWRAHEEGLPVAIVNPSLVIGSGFWEHGTARIFRQVTKGFPFYTGGTTGFVDVRDVARFCIDLMNSEVTGQRFVVSAENWAYRDFFRAIAASAGTRPPFLKFGGLAAEMAWRTEALRARLTASRPLVTRETARNAQETWYYSSEKLRRYFPDFVFTPIADTIRDTTRQLLSGESRLPI